MQTGTIKKFGVNAKYTFIIPDEGGKDIFLSKERLIKLEAKPNIEGQRVSFKCLINKNSLKVFCDKVRMIE